MDPSSPTPPWSVMYLAAGAQIPISPLQVSQAVFESLEDLEGPRTSCCCGPVVLSRERAAAAPHWRGGLGGLEDPQGELGQPSGLLGRGVWCRHPLRQLVF